MALLEPRQRQAQQVREHVREPLLVQPRRERQHRPAPQRGGRGLEQHQAAEAQAQHQQQVAVAGDEHVVDHPLQQEGVQQHESLEHQREHEDLRERALQAADGAQQLG